MRTSLPARPQHEHELTQWGQANVLIQDDGSPCLADMCLSLDTLHTGPRLESTRWMAVERLAGEEYERATMRKESDIWSLGTLVLEAFTGTVPYPHIPDSAYVAARVVSGERPVRPVGWDVVKYGMDDDLWDLLCACWDSDVSRRPTLGRVAGVVRRLAGAWVGGAGT
jgi:serine/threonine protein kinase